MSYVTYGANFLSWLLVFNTIYESSISHPHLLSQYVTDTCLNDDDCSALIFVEFVRTLDMDKKSAQDKKVGLHFVGK